ncbi:hypothetical protein NNRS527_01306 [Nitrosospira sp. NRS527]|nr:hypothetical protein NNRS527_01306 [Nitrosospira sp. NRS527]
MGAGYIKGEGYTGRLGISGLAETLIRKEGAAQFEHRPNMMSKILSFSRVLPYQG